MSFALKKSFYCWCSVAQLCLTLCNCIDCSMPGFPVLHYLLELTQTHVLWIFDAIQPSHPLLPPSPPSFFPNIRVFSSESAFCIRWLKSWSFSFSISPSSEYSGLISFRIDWLISLQSKGLSRVFFSTMVRKHQFFGAQPSLWSTSHICMTTGKTIALTIRTFLIKVMSLLFNMLSRSFPSKEQACFNFMAVITIHRDFGAQENKICHYFYLFPFYLPRSNGTGN